MKPFAVFTGAGRTEHHAHSTQSWSKITGHLGRLRKAKNTLAHLADLTNGIRMSRTGGTSVWQGQGQKREKSQEGGSRLPGSVRLQDWERRKVPRVDWRSSRKSGRKKREEGKMESSGILPVRPATMWPL